MRTGKQTLWNALELVFQHLVFHRYGIDCAGSVSVSQNGITDAGPLFDAMLKILR